MTNTYDICVVCIIILCCQILSAGLPSDILTCELIIAISGCLTNIEYLCMRFTTLHTFFCLYNSIMEYTWNIQICRLVTCSIFVLFLWGGGGGSNVNNILNWINCS